MENTRPIIYNMNGKQLGMMLGFGIVMLILGAWLTFLFKPHNYIAHYCFIGLGILCLLLAVYAISQYFKKVNGPKEGVIINDHGIIDNTFGHGVPIIKWEDIKGIREEFIAMNKFIRIDVANAEEYIQQGKTAAKRRGMKNYNRSSGSPFLIMARAVGMKHDDLFQIMRNEFLKEKEKRETISAAKESATSASTPTDDDKPDLLDM